MVISSPAAKTQSSIEIEATYYPELNDIKQMVLPCKMDHIDLPSFRFDYIEITTSSKPDHFFSGTFVTSK